MEVLKQVEEFHKAFGHPVKDKPEVPTNRAELRLSLILEELHELAEASGKLGTFNRLMIKKLGLDYEEVLGLHDVELETEDSNEGDIVECADAFGDILYVVAGGIHEYGLGEVMPAVSSNIHGSNMSKLCKGIELTLRTVAKYAEEGIETHYTMVAEDLYGVYRSSDNKVLKSVEYTPTNLSPIVLNQ
jgi:predicted HAD superfamily Cof-like phosphohydrolase